MNARVRLGFVSFAHGHAWGYAWSARSLPGVELAGVADPDPARGRDAARRLGMPFFARRRDLYAQGLDGVVVCSENARHETDVLEAARARVHVLCEKPLCVSAAAGRRMVAACARAGVSLQTAFPMRFSQPVLRTKALVDAGEIGRVLAANTTNHGSMPGGWFAVPGLSGGGATMDHTVHVADLLRWILRDEVVEVYAEIGRLLSPELRCDDSGLLSFRFRRGTFATLDASWSRRPGYPTWGDVTMSLWGERGVLTTDAFAQHVTVYGPRGARNRDWGSSADLGLVREFVAAIRERRPPGVTGEDGLAAAEVALAAYRSARTHRPVALTPRG